MNYHQNEPTNVPETKDSGREAELLAEILYRLSEKQKAGPAAGSRRQNSANAKTVNLEELLYFLLSKLQFIVAGMVLGGLLLGFYATVRTPMYSATSKLYLIGSTGSSIIADLQIGSVLTMDYQEVFKTWEVHQMVNEELHTNYSYGTLQSMISISNPSDTRVLYITARHSDSQMAADVANAYASAAKRFIVQTMATDEPTTFSIALVPSVPTNAGVTSFIVRGILLGTVLACGILVMIFLFDTRPKSPEDITRYAGIPTLAVIPAHPEFSGAKKHRKTGSP